MTRSAFAPMRRAPAGRSAAAALVLIGALIGGAGPAAAPQPRLNAYFAADFTDTAYQQKAVNKVLASWKPAGPVPAAGKKTVVISLIARDGSLMEARFHMASGSKGWDDAAMAAVRKAAPFPPLPGSYPRPEVEVHWHFSHGG